MFINYLFIVYKYNKYYSCNHSYSGNGIINCI